MPAEELEKNVGPICPSCYNYSWLRYCDGYKQANQNTIQQYPLDTYDGKNAQWQCINGAMLPEEKMQQNMQYVSSVRSSLRLKHHLLSFRSYQRHNVITFDFVWKFKNYGVPILFLAYTT